MDLRQQQTEELYAELDQYVSRLNAIAIELGPLLVEYGKKREEAGAIVSELRRRGALKEDG